MIPYGYVYVIVNRINGKSYIGSRKLSKDTSWRQYLGSGKLIRQAISKYGVENFSKVFVEYYHTQEELFSAEMSKITEEKSKGGAEYNLAIYTPKTDNFYSVAPGVQKLWRKNLSAGVRNSYSSRESPTTILFNRRLTEFKDNNSVDSVIEYYLECHNYEIVAKKFCTSRKVIKTILDENSIPSVRRHSEATKDKIAESLSGSARKFCSCGKKLSNKINESCFNCKYYISEDEESLVLFLKSNGTSVREISRICGVSRTRINRILKVTKDRCD